MRDLLAATEQYADIEVILEDTSAGKVKDRIRSFISQRQGKPINEVFFYFSGHGFYDSDLMLCCSDFDSKKPASTCVSNTEIDDLLRGLAPELAVKVLDAC